MARSKLTPERRETIVEALRSGNYDEAAARAAGISHQTFYNWLNRGQAEKERVEAGQSPGRRRVRDGERSYVEFFEAVTRARAEVEVRAVKEWTEAGKKDWRAWVEYLQRRYPKRWANTQRVEVQVERQLEEMFALLEAGLGPQEFRKVTGILANAGDRSHISDED